MNCYNFGSCGEPRRVPCCNEIVEPRIVQCCNERPEPRYDCKASAQFVSGLNYTPIAVGQQITGYWPLGSAQPIEFGITAIADGGKIQLSGDNTIILQPGRYLVDTHALLATFALAGVLTSEPIVTRLYLNGIALDYTVNSVDPVAQAAFINSTQINKANLVVVSQPNSALQWLAGNTVSANYSFNVYEASITIVEI